MNPMKHLVYLPLLLLFAACTSSKKLKNSREEQQTLPELPLSELDIPIKIAAAPILPKQVFVPSELLDTWPEFCILPRLRYKYRL